MEGGRAFLGRWVDPGLWMGLLSTFSPRGIYNHLLRGLHFTPLSYVPDYSLNRLGHSCTSVKEVTSAQSHTLDGSAHSDSSIHTRSSALAYLAE